MIKIEWLYCSSDSLTFYSYQLIKKILPEIFDLHWSLTETNVSTNFYILTLRNSDEIYQDQKFIGILS